MSYATGAEPEKIQGVVERVLEVVGDAIPAHDATRLALDLCAFVHPVGHVLSDPERERIIQEALNDYQLIRMSWMRAETPEQQAFLFWQIEKFIHPPERLSTHPSQA